MTQGDIADQADNRIYELGFHIISSIPEEKLTAEVTAIKDVLEENGAIFIAEDFPKLKHLSYVMTKTVGPKHFKFDTAYFGWVKFEMNPEPLDKVKKLLDRNDNILRFILIKTVRESTLAVVKPPVYRSESKPVGSGEIPKNKEIKSPVS
ncbi:MAG: 30S ribosomal protein S6, partial [bacterium]|nr:30S ribosomal protein S6 [bacterium]